MVDDKEKGGKKRLPKLIIQIKFRSDRMIQVEGGEEAKEEMEKDINMLINPSLFLFRKFIINRLT